MPPGDRQRRRADDTPGADCHTGPMRDARHLAILLVILGALLLALPAAALAGSAGDNQYTNPFGGGGSGSSSTSSAPPATTTSAAPATSTTPVATQASTARSDRDRRCRFEFDDDHGHRRRPAADRICGRRGGRLRPRADRWRPADPPTRRPRLTGVRDRSRDEAASGTPAATKRRPDPSRDEPGAGTASSARRRTARAARLTRRVASECSLDQRP